MKILGRSWPEKASELRLFAGKIAPSIKKYISMAENEVGIIKRHEIRPLLSAIAYRVRRVRCGGTISPGIPHRSAFRGSVAEWAGLLG